jgi:ABC-type nitrate/sulfonate/bicarbonate transport system substrate-binding protein
MMGRQSCERIRKEIAVKRLSRLALKCLILAVASVLATATPQAQQPREIIFGVASGSLVAAPPRIAKEMGLFEKRGLSARVVMMESANAATTALISGAVHVNISGPGELVVAQGRGQKVVAIANTYGGLGGSLVLAKSVAGKLRVAPNAPIAERLKALDGLLIASTTATSAYTVAYKSAAKVAGAEIRFTYMTLPAMAAALESGAIQGYIGGAPFWAIPLVKGAGVLWISGPKRELPAEVSPVSSANLQMMRAKAEANPDLVAAIVGVFADFAVALDTRPADVKAAIAKLYPDLDAATLDLLFASESLAWKPPPLTAADMAHEIAFVKASGTPLPEIDKIDPASLLFP